MREVYEKPQMKFVSLRNSENVAATCWGNHGTGVKEYFYDTKGTGFVEFSVDASNCTLLSTTSLKFYKDKDAYKDGKGEIINGGPAFEDWIDAIKNAGGNSGNPVHGQGTVFVEGTPGETFS